jgi:hypothetical protein
MIVVLISDGAGTPKASTCISMDGLKKAFTETGLPAGSEAIWGQIQNGCLR